MQIYTIGGYGHTESTFMRSLQESGIQAFVDIRQRRGMRGSSYAFLNSTKLQSNLSAIGIAYIHLKNLAPSDEICKLQKIADSTGSETKRGRAKLSEGFIETYKNGILKPTSQSAVLDLLKAYDKVCFFCVEKGHEACHRSIVTDWLEPLTGKARHI